METAASVIAFAQVAAAIGKCAVKTKKLWDQAQDLPDEIQALILRLQSYESIFQIMDKQFPIQQHLQSLPTYPLVQDNLRTSIGALELLREKADSLMSHLDAKKGLRRKLAAVKIIIGKDNSDQLKNRLNDSIALLNLSLQAWNMTITMLTPDLIVAQLNQTSKSHQECARLPEKSTIVAEDESKTRQAITTIKHNTIQSGSRHDGKLTKIYTPSKLGRFAMAYTTSSGAWQAYIQWPSWLSTSVYELQSSPSLGGWSYNYRVYNIISPKSEIIEKIEMGDKNGVLELFNTRKASPFDKDNEGRSLLYYAANSKHFDLCQLFLNLGLQNALIDRVGKMNEQISSFDVGQSSQEKLSLVHSAAIAMSIRFADEAIPQKRGTAQWSLYNDSWSHLVEQVATAASVDDLHSYETVRPWDVYHVPVWTGTPLVSVIGGALCYLSPDVSFYHWDSVFQQLIQEWVRNLQAGGVDLAEYGRWEAHTLREQMRGALDSNAIEMSRNSIRDTLPSYCATSKVRERAGVWNENHWVPVRLLDLQFGPSVSDWQIVWAPEFEWMASEFWKMIEKEDPIMPGSWIES
ncbi:hypothetical protein FHETE_4284 [Fusarium heterosporum]|uniref:NACHT-NTPase and P-loop NTPases N-terminal domain-containing protein n=1 Tax=Fusarium heterosporum TaxID=42747 RepID=A0A8H5WUR3_FUSHE|nr:hypothetical protein FHETE_4284 [Fusarium heterosporum]